MKEFFKTHEPLSIKLRDYISYYYFHSSDEVDKETAFTYYPHYKNAFTIYKNSEVELLDETHSKTTPSKKKYTYSYAQLMRQFGKAQIHSPFNKIGIVFQPLGLNHFINEDLSSLIQHQLKINFTYFEKEMEAVLDKIYKTTEINEKVNLLDDFFEKAFVGFEDERIIKAVKLITDGEGKHTVQSLAEELDINRKTLLRLFKRHLNCTVKEYINLVQFRKAVDVYQKSLAKPTLTGLAYDMDYYDQSEFIHHFYKITGVNPKRFFFDLVSYGDKSTYWAPEK